MITLIGKYTSLIGFGLCGIKDIREIDSKTSDSKVISFIAESKNNIIMIDEGIYERVKDEAGKTSKIFIKIPDLKTNGSQLDDVDELVKDAIGVSIKT